MRGSSISSAATPAHWSVVMLRMQLPEVCIACILDLGEIGERVRHLLELDPVELDVLPGGEMAVAAVVAARHMRQHAHLVGRQRAVRDRDPQHVGVQLQIDAVHQAQDLELVLGQRAGEPAAHLVAEFRDALVDQRLVEIVVAVHLLEPQAAPGSVKVGPASRMRSRRLPGSTRLSARHLDRRDIGADGTHAVGFRALQQHGRGRRRDHRGGREIGRPVVVRRCDRPPRRRRAGWRSRPRSR